MSKPIAEPIVWTYRDEQYRSTLKQSGGRGRKSVITIKTVGNSKPKYEIYLSDISPESEKSLLELVSQGWWVNFNRTRMGDSFIMSDTLKNMKFLGSKGLEPWQALRSSLIFAKSELTKYYTVETIFGEFESMGKSVDFEMFDRVDRSNFDMFLDMSSRFGVDLSRKVMERDYSEPRLITEKYYLMMVLPEWSKTIDCVVEFTEQQIKAFKLFQSFVSMKSVSNSLPIARMVSKISDSSFKLMDIQADLLHHNRSIIEHLEPRDVSVWMDYGMSKGLEGMILSAMPGKLTMSWQRLLVILMNRYGLQTVVTSLQMFEDDRTDASQAFVNLILVADFIEDGGDASTPLPWIVALNQTVVEMVPTVLPYT